MGLRYIDPKSTRFRFCTPTRPFKDTTMDVNRQVSRWKTDVLDTITYSTGLGPLVPSCMKTLHSNSVHQSQKWNSRSDLPHGNGNWDVETWGHFLRHVPALPHCDFDVDFVICVPASTILLSLGWDITPQDCLCNNNKSWRGWGMNFIIERFYDFIMQHLQYLLIPMHDVYEWSGVLSASFGTFMIDDHRKIISYLRWERQSEGNFMRNDPFQFCTSAIPRYFLEV